MIDYPDMFGRCPDCAQQIPTTRALVEYEKTDTTNGVWADCPGCGDAVALERLERTKRSDQSQYAGHPNTLGKLTDYDPTAAVATANPHTNLFTEVTVL